MPPPNQSRTIKYPNHYRVKRVRIKDSLIQSENKDDDIDNGVGGERANQEQREEEEDEANDQVRRYPRRITAQPNYYHETRV